MTKIKGKTVLITGGAMGMGKIMARKCGEQAAKNIIIWDINEEKLTATTNELRGKGYAVYPYIVDVSNLDDIKAGAKEVLQEFNTVDILFNNAGVVVGKPFKDQTHIEIQQTVDINVAGVMHVALAFLPTMIAQKSGHIVNLASAASYIANPNMSVYAASKWAVLGWSDSIRLELAAMPGKLRVTTVCPSYINTGMFEGVKEPFLTPELEPEYVVTKIMEAVRKNSIIIHEPAMVNALPLLKGLLPTRVFDKVVGKGFGVYKTMETFKGRKNKIPSMPEEK